MIDVMMRRRDGEPRRIEPDLHVLRRAARQRAEVQKGSARGRDDDARGARLQLGHGLLAQGTADVQAIAIDLRDFRGLVADEGEQRNPAAVLLEGSTRTVAPLTGAPFSSTTMPETWNAGTSATRMTTSDVVRPAVTAIGRAVETSSAAGYSVSVSRTAGVAGAPDPGRGNACGAGTAPRKYEPERRPMIRNSPMSLVRLDATAGSERGSGQKIGAGGRGSGLARCSTITYVSVSGVPNGSTTRPVTTPPRSIDSVKPSSS